jgi:hypothetical protein
MKSYAGLWQRVGAFILDYGIILVYLGAVTLIFLFMNSVFSVNQWLFADRIRAQLAGILLITLPVTLYFVFSESSLRQATWGKQRLGLKVTDHNGNRISFSRSLSPTSRESMQMFFELKEPLFPKSDLDLCAALNVFDFAMPVTRQNGHFRMRAIKP